MGGVIDTGMSLIGNAASAVGSALPVISSVAAAIPGPWQVPALAFNIANAAASGNILGVVAGAMGANTAISSLSDMTSAVQAADATLSAADAGVIAQQYIDAGYSAQTIQAATQADSLLAASQAAAAAGTIPTALTIAQAGNLSANGLTAADYGSILNSDPQAATQLADYAAAQQTWLAAPANAGKTATNFKNVADSGSLGATIKALANSPTVQKVLTSAGGVLAYNALKTNPQNPSQYVVDPATGKVISSSVTTPSGTTTTFDPRISALQNQSLTGTAANVVGFNAGLAPLQTQQANLATQAANPAFNLDAALASYNTDIGGVKSTQANMLGQYGALGTQAGGANMNLDAATGALKTGYTPLQGQQADVTSKLQGLYGQAGDPFMAAALNPIKQAGATAQGALTENLGVRGMTGSSFGQQAQTNLGLDYGTALATGTENALKQQIGLQAGLAGQIGSGTQAQMGAVKDIYGADQTALQARQAQIDQQAKMDAGQLGVSQAQQGTSTAQFGASQTALDAQHSQLATQLGISKDQVSLLATKLAAGQQLTAQEQALAGTLTDTQLAQMKMGTTGAALGATNVANQNATMARLISGGGSLLGGGNTNALGQTIP